MEKYWSSLPIGKENAVTYATLCAKWKRSEREVRKILHELSLYDSGDDYILIRSASSKGFYKTNDINTIKAYRKECISKAKNNFAPLRKINRLLSEADDTQMNFYNNLKNARLAKGLKQIEVVQEFKRVNEFIDVTLLSKYENSVCLPTPYQLCLLARIYGCKPSELIDTELAYNIA
jgi:ribosome-binding protein aMBF1 (putative translation factor)